MDQVKALHVPMCHASEDKARFAEPLATMLRERFVDIWLDKWEIRLGDSLVRRVFDDAVGKADAVIFLLSNASVIKPWVQAELDLSVIRRLEEGIRIIPVLVEPCEVPQCLRATKYIELAKAGSLQAVAEEIASTLHGTSVKPPLGQPPEFLTRKLVQLPGLDMNDSAVMQFLYEASVSGELGHIDVRSPMAKAAEQGIGETTFKESLEILIERGRLLLEIRSVGQVIVVSIPPWVFLEVAAANGIDVSAQQRRVAALILNEDVKDYREIQQRLDLPSGVVQGIVDNFRDQGFLQRTWPIYRGSSACVTTTTASFRRWLRDAGGIGVG